MRYYTMQDRSTGIPTRTDINMTLQQVIEMTDWTAVEIDRLAELAIGEEALFDNGNLYVQRTVEPVGCQLRAEFKTADADGYVVQHDLLDQNGAKVADITVDTSVAGKTVLTIDVRETDAELNLASHAPNAQLFHDFVVTNPHGFLQMMKGQ